MENIIFRGDYFSKTVGYVIDGRHFKNRTKAMVYLQKPTVGMDSFEANSYLDRLVRVFLDKTNPDKPHTIGC